MKVPKRKIFFLLLFSLLPMVAVQADESFESSESSPAVAQETLASLFGRGAKMPVAPRMSGKIALPSFDSSDLKIDERIARGPSPEESLGEGD